MHMHGLSYLVLEVRDQHAKLRAPVANVIDAHRLVARVFERAGETLSNDGRTQVAHVHLCHVLHRIDH